MFENSWNLGGLKTLTNFSTPDNQTGVVVDLFFILTAQHFTLSQIRCYPWGLNGLDKEHSVVFQPCPALIILLHLKTPWAIKHDWH